MARFWKSLPENDPALKIHGLLHDAVELWLKNTCIRSSGLYVLTGSLEPSLHPRRARRVANNIINQMRANIDAIIEAAAEGIRNLPEEDWE
jgi:hypothetical protein